MSTLAEVAPIRHTLDRCAARLIPGRSHQGDSQRKSPSSIGRNSSPSQFPGSLALPRAEASERFMECVLPSPKSGPRLAVAVLVDYVLILVCWLVAFVVESGLGPAPGPSPVSVPRESAASGEAGEALLFAVITTLFGFSEGLYAPDSIRHVPQAVILTKVIAWTTLLQGLVLRLISKDEFLSISLILAACLSGCTLVGWRIWRRHRIRNAGNEHNVLIVGAGRPARELARFFTQHPESHRQVRGFLDRVERPTSGVLGPPEKLAEIARAEFVDEVIVALPGDSQLARQVIGEARSHNLDVKAVPDLFGCEAGEPWVEYAGEIPLITLHREPLPAAALFCKRALDVAGSACALVLLLPVLLVVSALVWLDSGGPILYSAPRVGKRGQRFQCHKFRTMIRNAGELKDRLREQNQREGPCFKIVDDPRITKVGRFLRRYSLDEVPQLWNVLRGDMSLVGPRPHPVDDFSRYALEHFRRLDVTPGITGLWQVTARRSPSFHLNLALDLEYIEKWSLWLDLRILAKTLAVVFQGTGA